MDAPGHPLKPALKTGRRTDASTPRRTPRRPARTIKFDSGRRSPRTRVIDSLEDPPDPPETVDRGHTIEVRSGLVLALAFAVLFIGTSCEALIAVLVNRKAPPCRTCEPEYFLAQQLLQTGQTLGQALCLLVYYVERWLTTHLRDEPEGYFEIALVARRRCERVNTIERQVQTRWYHWLAPAVCDTLGTTCLYYAYTMLNVSSVQVLMSFSIVFTALMAMVLFHRPVKIFVWIGIAMIALAATLVTIDYATMSLDTSYDVLSLTHGHNRLYGSLFALAALILFSVELLLFEYYTTVYYVTPLKAVGQIGANGLLLSAALLVTADLVGYEKLAESVYQVFNTSLTRGAAVSMIFMVALLNVASLCLTSASSSLFTSTVLALRLAPLYILEAAAHWLPVTVLGSCSVAFCLLGTLFYLGFVHRFLPERVRTVCEAQARMQCSLITYEADPVESEESSASTEDCFVDEEYYNALVGNEKMQQQHADALAALAARGNAFDQRLPTNEYCRVLQDHEYKLQRSTSSTGTTSLASVASTPVDEPWLFIETIESARY